MASARYIRIDRKSLHVSVVEKGPRSGIVVPAENEGASFQEIPLRRMLYRDVLYPLAKKWSRQAGVDVRFSLDEPEPWLVAIACVMWQGLIQGLTWEAVKAIVLEALNTLRESDLIISAESAIRGTVVFGRLRPGEKCEGSSERRFGVSWKMFSEDGEPLHELFVGIEKKFSASAARERKGVVVAGRGVRRRKGQGGKKVASRGHGMKKKQSPKKVGVKKEGTKKRAKNGRKKRDRSNPSSSS